VFEGLTEWVADVVDALGYVGVAFLVALENLFPPIPSEVVLPMAGFVAGRGDAWVVGMVIASTIGSVVGALALYAIAAAIGPERLRAIVVRHGKWLRLTEKDLDKAEDWFDRRSTFAVLVGRCVPLIRSLVSIPAGFRRMPIGQFTLYTLIGSVVWNSALVGAGYALGDRWEQVGDWVGYFQYVVIAGFLVALGWFVWTRYVSPKRGARAEARGGQADEQHVPRHRAGTGGTPGVARHGSDG
jgi:membrane protein DedA with SNARE-associated domain